jgi:hypothetical protein
LHKKVPGTTRWLEEAGIDTVRFVLDEIQHRLNRPSRREDLTVVGYTLPGSDQWHSCRLSALNRY